MTDSETNLSGEARHKKRRNAFWRYLALGIGASLIAGFMGGYFTALFENGDVPIAVPLAIFGVVVAGLMWFTWDYFRRIDELDLMDNLWAHLIGQYVAVTGFISWYFFAEIGLVGYPTAIAVITMLIGGTFLAYGLRKLGWR
ncbi:hypothetical protein OAS19_03910 [Altererythrobacter sp.]|nr:hypothetical protein [Altererythrobacter sp.]